MYRVRLVPWDYSKPRSCLITAQTLLPESHRGRADRRSTGSQSMTWFMKQLKRKVETYPYYFVPGPFASDAALEAGLNLVVITAEGVPLLDVMRVMNLATEKGVSVIGPDTAGLISPGRCKVGVHPHKLFMEGNVGVVRARAMQAP